MIIDTHTHINGGIYSPGEYLSILDEYDVSKVWISSVEGITAHGKYRESNKFLYNFCKDHEDRLVGFCSVNPNCGTEVIDELKKCKEVYGFPGLKLHPWLQGFPVSSSIMDDITEACIRNDMPIIFHDGTPPYSSTLQIAGLAERYPEAKIILGHSGLIEMYDDAISAARRLKNIYLSVCGPSIYQLGKIVSSVPDDRIMFGSDFGFSNSVNGLKYRLDMWNYVEMEDSLRKKLFYSNAVSFMGGLK